jgi:hypothetical protein
MFKIGTTAARTLPCLHVLELYRGIIALNLNRLLDAL